MQLFNLPGVKVEGFKAIFVYFESQSYNGPGVQLFWGENMLSVRLFVVLLGVIIAALVAVNVGLLIRLASRGLIRACLIRSTGTGLAMLLSSIASATYLCCGWAPTVALLGISVASSLGLIPAIASAILLTLNAFILRKRLASAVLLKPS